MSHCASSTTSPRSQDVTASSRVATTPSATANSLDSINSSHNSNNSFQQSSVRLTTSAALHKTTIESSTSRNTSSTSSSSTDDAPMLRQPVLDSNSLDELLLLRHFSCFETTIFNFFPIFPPSIFEPQLPSQRQEFLSNLLTPEEPMVSTTICSIITADTTQCTY